MLCSPAIKKIYSLKLAFYNPGLEVQMEMEMFSCSAMESPSLDLAKSREDF